MCKLVVAVTILMSMPVLFVVHAQAATAGPASVLQGAAQAGSAIEAAAACARRRVCGARGCAWRTVCGGRRW
jgi:hypothetical protein